MPTTAPDLLVCFGPFVCWFVLICFGWFWLVSFGLGRGLLVCFGWAGKRRFFEERLVFLVSVGKPRYGCL